MGNIVRISHLMLLENILNFVLSIIVGVKMILETLRNDKTRLFCLTVPIFFGLFWLMILNSAKAKKGEYGSPPGMLYMQ